MKIPKLKKKDKRSELEKERDEYVKLMGKFRKDSDVYRTMATTVRILSEGIHERPTVNAADIAKVVIPVIGTALVCVTNVWITSKITKYEEEDILTTKSGQHQVPWNA